MFTDTHCHLDDSRLAACLPQVMAAARQAGVTRFVIPGVAPADWERINLTAQAWPGVYPAFGLHPMFAAQYDDALLDRLRTVIPTAVALGEIGLDYLRTDVPREIQQEAFRNQLRLAVAHDLPVLIHCRRAFQDLLRILKEEKVARVGGVMHAFSGSPETAFDCIKLGLFISVSGTATYTNAVKPIRIIEEIPLVHLVLETDAPDLTPEPYRGRLNEPAYLIATARKIADVKGTSLAEVSTTTTRNADRLFAFSRLDTRAAGDLPDDKNCPGEVLP